MREAASIFADEASRRLGLTSIEATCLPDNAASKAKLQGLGFAFVREGSD